MGISSESPLTCHLAFRVLSLCLACLRAVPCVCASPNQDGWGRGPQLLHTVEWCPPLFISSFVVGKASMTPRMRNAWSLSLLDRAQLLPPGILEFISTEEKMFHWGPFYLLSQFFWSQVLISLFVCLFVFNFYFIFKTSNTVLVLPNIKMNPPQIYLISFDSFYSW